MGIAAAEGEKKAWPGHQIDLHSPHGKNGADLAYGFTHPVAVLTRACMSGISSTLQRGLGGSRRVSDGARRRAGTFLQSHPVGTCKRSDIEPFQPA